MKYGPVGFKPAPWAREIRDVDPKTGKEVSGICLSCGNWDPELIDSVCRDDECRRKRDALAIAEGRAVSITTDLPGGRSILWSKSGKEIIK